MSESPPGLAVERTVLAWWRTWLAVGGCGLLLFRMSIGSTAREAAALAIGAAALVLTTLAGRRRATHLRAIAPQPAALRVRDQRDRAHHRDRRAVRPGRGRPGRRAADPGPGT